MLNLLFSEGTFSKGWKKYFVQLHKDSMLVFKKKSGVSTADAAVVLKV